MKHRRSLRGIHSKASKLNIEFLGNWSREEDDILREYYPTEGNKVYLRLPAKTKKETENRAYALKLKKIPILKWSSEEDEILRQYYPSE